MSWRGAALLVLLASCAPRGPVTLSGEQLKARASRPIPAAFDEAYDATWLTLESLGFTIVEHDRRAGTLLTDALPEPKGTTHRWSAAVSQEGANPVVTVLPQVFEGEKEITAEIQWTVEGPGGEQEKWDDFFAKTRWLIESWRHHPELLLATTRGEVDAAGLRVLLPPTWSHFDFAVDRRTLSVQRSKHAPGDINPTVVYRLERRRPEADVEALVHETLERAFRSWGKVAEPGEWTLSHDASGVRGEGEVLLGPELVAWPVRWWRWEARSPAWVVRVAAACAPSGARACDDDTHAIVESAADENGRLVNPGGAVPGFKAR